MATTDAGASSFTIEVYAWLLLAKLGRLGVAADPWTLSAVRVGKRRRQAVWTSIHVI
ncbi:MAG: hypothetical protein ACRD01_00535 [Terriglobales bacterium]